MGRIRRVGFVMDDMVPSLRAVCAGRCGVRGYLHGDLSSSSCATMRFGWVAAAVNRQSSALGLRYEAYRSWRAGSYDALVFLKSMGAESLAIAQGASVPTVFDVNVDYRTVPTGQFFYEGMETTEEQRASAAAMTEASDAVIADSEHIAGVWEAFERPVSWIPDNVTMSMVPDAAMPFRLDGGKLTLLWSGEAVKLFDLLAIEPALRRYADRIRLVLVTSDLAALDRWYDGSADRFRELLGRIEHEVVPFQSVRHLLELYAARPGVFISPRYLNNSYNLGHTEWKITLPMACGRYVLCTPQRSYLGVQTRSGGRGLRVCETDDDWCDAFEALLGSRVDVDAEGAAGRGTVAAHYATEVVARQHADVMLRLLDGGGMKRSGEVQA